MTLAEFLLARIAEDEAAAREARRDELAYSSRPSYAKLGFTAGDLAQRFDPARVLAECEAKRQIVDEHAGGGGPLCDVCAEGIWDREDLPLPCPTLRFLALPYVDREGYDEEWRP